MRGGGGETSVGYVYGGGNSKALSLHNDEQRALCVWHMETPCSGRRGARSRVSMKQKDGVHAPAPALSCTHVHFVPWNLGVPWIPAVCSPPSDSLFLNRKAMLESFCQAQIDAHSEMGNQGQERWLTG